MKGCGSCGFWSGLEEFLDRDDPHQVGKKVELGTCRRSAPQVTTVVAEADHKAPRLESYWPTTASDDWCGVWEPNYG